MRATLLLLGLVFACNGGSNRPNVTDPRLEGVLEKHNELRAAASPTPSPALPEMIWDEDLAEEARIYAELCDFAHDNNRGDVGENIAVNAPAGFQSGPDVVANWASEVANYNYADNSCNGVCGHYTQIVWRDSTVLGCGVATCDGISGFTSGEGELWVCRYRSPGNFIGERPY
jgi:pathogenesis-related protein 1